MKKIILVLSVLALFVACGKKKDEKVSIGITQIVQHPSLDAIRNGIIDTMAEAGYVDGENIEVEFQNAQGEMANAQIIANAFVDDKKDLIVAITTPSAQAALNATNEIPVVYSAVTDPVAAGLEGENIAGVSDMTPIKQQFELLKKLIPGAEVVGMVYNSSEQNSEVQVKKASLIAEEMGLELKLVSVTNVNEVPPALDSIMDEIDVLYTHIDNMLASTYPVIVQKTEKMGVPIIGAVEDYVHQGALATEGINQYKIGVQTGEMIVNFLKGQDIKGMGMELAKDTDLVINEIVAEKLGINISEELKDRAVIVNE